MKVFARPLLAIVFGAFILCTETCLHFDSILNPSSWIDLPIHDWLAGVFLIWSGVISRRDWTHGRPYQAAAWAFILSLLVGAFVAHWEEWSLGEPGGEWISAGAFVGILAGLVVVAAGGLVSTLAVRRD